MAQLSGSQYALSDFQNCILAVDKFLVVNSRPSYELYMTPGSPDAPTLKNPAPWNRFGHKQVKYIPLTFSTHSTAVAIFNLSVPFHYAIAELEIEIMGE